MIKTPQLQLIAGRISDALQNSRISEAFSELTSMAEATSAPWAIKNEIARLQEGFGFLREYAVSGVEDPSRDDILAEIKAGIITQTEAIVRLSMIEESPKIYFSNLRYERLQSDSSIPGLIGEFTAFNSALSMMTFTSPSAKSDNLKMEKNRQMDMARRIFNVIWTAFPLKPDDATAIRSVLSEETIRSEFRELFLSAVMLGAFEFYDERRIVLLAETYLTATGDLELRALVGLVLSLWMQRESLSGKSLKNVMDSVREKKGWADDLKMIFLNLVRTRDTDRITRTMNEEVIPGMMKLRPEIFRKFSGKDLSDEFDPEEMNPEWESLLEKSGMADKLKALNDLQSEGGDVMHSTFAALKGFPFFHQVPNWFLPFFTEQTDVADVLAESADDLGELIAMMPMICDNDKYSLVMSMSQMPSANRRMMVEQFKMQNINLSELRNSLLNPEIASRSNRANDIIHDFYRFFTLFRRKSEFVNPFAKPINLAAVGLLSPDLVDREALQAVGEFYFKRGYHTEALEVFRLLLSEDGAASLWQKAGYCEQQLGNITEALSLYRRSELLSPPGQWLRRRIAYCLKMLGKHEEAVGYYKELSEEKPRDLGLALSLGHCYLALGRFSEALQCYFKVEYLDENGSKALRPIAWCSFVEGDYERSEKYYAKILAGDPTPTDYLNVGHLYLVRRNFKEAAGYYSAYLQKVGGDSGKLYEAVSADKEYLAKAGVDPLLVSLVLDKAVFPAS